MLGFYLFSYTSLMIVGKFKNKYLWLGLFSFAPIWLIKQITNCGYFETAYKGNNLFYYKKKKEMKKIQLKSNDLDGF